MNETDASKHAAALDGWTRNLVEDPRNWNFSSVPSDQRLHCRTYERTRHCATMRRTVQEGRQKHGLKTFDEHVQFHLNHMLEAANYYLLYPFAWHPEWPEKPYLSIAAPERQKRMSWVRVSTSLRRGDFNQAIFNRGSIWVWRIADGTLTKNIEIKSGWLRFKDLPPDLAKKHFIYDPENTVLLTVPIDIRKPVSNDLELIRGLILHIQQTLSVETEPDTGGGSLPREALADLKALGAWRLLQFMTWQEASIVTAKATAGGKSLFSSQSRWIEARKRGEALALQ